ncbi:hypothetical protein EGR_02514 [Echinococcus granulosus]|uniref:Uncharacterized protein n=1 Tax=Echinococcus granulosus TaxID=6210 RepID=W6UNG3_ECHGR|nr:hypothetical protein EGR_02514 [Echinococcus granulosus]EUB62718.1 hypothetical protein EGR_02514 [Echinococcus granulosus]
MANYTPILDTRYKARSDWLGGFKWSADIRRRVYECTWNGEARCLCTRRGAFYACFAYRRQCRGDYRDHAIPSVSA